MTTVLGFSLEGLCRDMVSYVDNIQEVFENSISKLRKKPGFKETSLNSTPLTKFQLLERRKVSRVFEKDNYNDYTITLNAACKKLWRYIGAPSAARSTQSCNGTLTTYHAPEVK